MENSNLVDIPDYEGLYQFDNELNQVFGIKNNRYLKNNLANGILQVRLCKNGKGKTYSIRQLFIICNNLIENNNLVDIPNYEGIYKLDTELEKVYNTQTNKYLKNW